MLDYSQLFAPYEPIGNTIEFIGGDGTDIPLFPGPKLTDTLVLSASSLKTYKQCGRQFYLYKVLKVKPTHQPFHYGWVGTIVHNSIYYSIADYIDEEWHVRDAKSLSKVENFFNMLWEGDSSLQVARHLMMDGEVSPDKPNFAPGAMKNTKYANMNVSEEEKWRLLAQELVGAGYNLMLRTIMRDYETVKLEQTLKYRFKDRANIIGYIDILCTTRDGDVHFYDLKTSTRPPNLDTDIQFYLYRDGLKTTLGLPQLPTGHYVHLRSKKVLTVDYQAAELVTRNDNEIFGLLHGIDSMNWEPNLYHPLSRFNEYRGYYYSSEGQAISSRLEDRMEVAEELDPNEGHVVYVVTSEDVQPE